MAELRQHSFGALLELFELDAAVGEVALGAKGLSAAVREIAEEATQLASEPAKASPARASTRGLPRKVSQTAEEQAPEPCELGKASERLNRARRLSVVPCAPCSSARHRLANSGGSLFQLSCSCSEDVASAGNVSSPCASSSDGTS